MIEIADGVFVRRHVELDLTLGLVVGDGECLVIDTGMDPLFAAELPHPCRVVLTHNHFDHCLATEAFLPCEVWAHERCVVDERVLVERAEYYPDPIDVRLIAPTHTFTGHVTLDVGGRRVDLWHFGPAHTDHDVVVHIPDAGVVFAGDLVEQGAPPQVGPDSDPANWPRVLHRLLALEPGIIVPGHGNPVDREFVLNAGLT